MRVRRGDVGAGLTSKLLSMRVLVVEDEPDLRRTIAQGLREDGYAVDEAADG